MGVVILKAHNISPQKMSDAIKSMQVKVGKKFYFFDVKQAKNGNKYLQITESRLEPNGERIRNSITVFPDHLAEFKMRFDEIIEAL